MDWAVQDIVQGRWGEGSAASLFDFKVCSYFSFRPYYAGDSGLTISSMASLLTIPLPLRRAVMHGGQSKSRGFIHNTFTTGIFISYDINASVRAYSVRVIHSNESAMIITAFLIFEIDILSWGGLLPLNMFEHLRLYRRISATCHHWMFPWTAKWPCGSS